MSDYLFKMRVVDKDPTGYYHVRWDRATPVEVIAANRDQAFERVWAVMGKAPAHRTWTAQVDSIGPAPVNVAEARAQALLDFADAHRMPFVMFRRDDGSEVTVGDLLRETAARIARGGDH